MFYPVLQNSQLLVYVVLYFRFCVLRSSVGRCWCWFWVLFLLFLQKIPKLLMPSLYHKTCYCAHHSKLRFIVILLNLLCCGVSGAFFCQYFVDRKWSGWGKTPTRCMGQDAPSFLKGGRFARWWECRVAPCRSGPKRPLPVLFCWYILNDCRYRHQTFRTPPGIHFTHCNNILFQRLW